MKKTIIYSMCFLGLILVGCNKIETEIVITGNRSFTAGLESPQMPDGTKVSISGLVTSFESGDDISVFNSSWGRVRYSTTDGSTFTTEATENLPNWSDQPMAVFPDYEWAKLRVATSTVSSVLEKNQKVRNGKFPFGQANGAPIYVARSSSTGNLSFYNACAILKFQVAEDMESITIQETGDGDGRASIAGRLRIQLDGGSVTTTMDTDDNWEIKDLYITKDGGGNLTAGEVYYVAIAPCTMANGIKFGLPNKTGYKNYKQSKWGVSKTFVANKIYNMGTISYEAE